MGGGGSHTTGTRHGEAGMIEMGAGMASGNGGIGKVGGEVLGGAWSIGSTGGATPSMGKSGWQSHNTDAGELSGNTVMGLEFIVLSIVDRPGLQKGKTDSQKTALSDTISLQASGSQNRQPL